MSILMKTALWEPTGRGDHDFEPLFEAFGDRYSLTRREKEVLSTLLTWGLRNEDLSSTLHISVKTVKHHLASLMEKTRTRSSRELQALFLRSLLSGSTLTLQ
ncbi:response regulator transcription factor [Cohnella candidum]|nr:helix-turn-helix transcriptional regulator [Cohnella candidum]